MSVGNTNLLKISQDPKILFYYRNKLEDLDLIKSTDILQHIENRGLRSIFLRLTRFYTPRVLTSPKAGRIYELRKHLLSQPELKDNKLNLLSSKLLNQSMWRSLQKKVNIFKFVSILFYLQGNNIFYLQVIPNEIIKSVIGTLHFRHTQT